MSFYSQDEQEMIYHTFSCFKVSLLHLIKNGYGVVVSKEDSDDIDQYLVCNVDGDLKIFDLYTDCDCIKDGTLMKVSDNTENIH